MKTANIHALNRVDSNSSLKIPNEQEAFVTNEFERKKSIVGSDVQMYKCVIIDLVMSIRNLTLL